MVARRCPIGMLQPVPSWSLTTAWRSLLIGGKSHQTQPASTSQAWCGSRGKAQAARRGAQFDLNWEAASGPVTRRVCELIYYDGGGRRGHNGAIQAEPFSHHAGASCGTGAARTTRKALVRALRKRLSLRSWYLACSPPSPLLCLVFGYTLEPCSSGVVVVGNLWEE